MIQRAIENVTGWTKVEQDRLAIDDSTSDATLYIEQDRNEALSSDEPHIELTVSTENGLTSISLDGEQMDGMIDALYDIQQSYAESQEVMD